ncbi:MAG: hypothetical protein ACI9P3_006976 [Bradyrhizobium sp.]|jgi:hypothetical protein
MRANISLLAPSFRGVDQMLDRDLPACFLLASSDNVMM